VDKPFESYESGKYLANNPSWDEEDSEWKAKQVLKIIENNSLNPKSVVDVGCGAGGVLAKLHDSLPNVYYSGFEIALDVCGFWVKHSSRKINFSIANFLEEDTVYFDVLLLLDVFEHIPNPFEFLSALQGRAKYYIFHIPLDLSAISVVRESPLLHVREKVGHIHYYTKGMAISLLEECGFQIVDWSFTGAAFTNPRPTWMSMLAALPRCLFFAINRDLGVRMLGGDTLIVLAKANKVDS